MARTAVAPAPETAVAGEALRFVAIRANLMPAEIVTARAVVRTRKLVLAGLVAVVGLLIAWYALSWWQTSRAHDSLDSEQSRANVLRSQQLSYGPLVQALTDTDSVHSRLRGLMVGDLSWTHMLTTLRDIAPSGVAVTSVNGTVTAGAAASAPGAANNSGGDYALLNQSGKQAVGTLVVQGTAGDQRSIAAYVDRLGQQHGLTAPVLSSMTTSSQGFAFSVTVVITSDALGGRFATTTSSTPSIPSTTTTGGSK